MTAQKDIDAATEWLKDQYCDCGCVEYPHDMMVTTFVAGLEKGRLEKDEEVTALKKKIESLRARCEELVWEVRNR